MPAKEVYSHIIWDWNGTLFNDVAWCFQIINRMLAKRSLKELPEIAAYHKVFGFPIAEYYQKVGFDFGKEPFAELAAEYMAAYHAQNSGGCCLHTNAEAVLRAIHNKGITQVILSASETGRLLTQVGQFGISEYLDQVLGISDIYAAGKLEIALDYVKRARARRVLLIGDTEHDYEVAQVLSADCLLIEGGHHSKERLLACNVPVLADIADVLEYVGLERRVQP